MNHITIHIHGDVNIAITPDALDAFSDSGAFVDELFEMDDAAEDENAGVKEDTDEEGERESPSCVASKELFAILTEKEREAFFTAVDAIIEQLSELLGLCESERENHDAV